jgi:alkanesulfonate monooxygenase SsuD/methylene tetrahydromethanopterin reductase-like flavin-dependent oxidoreductase (luciferase family)
VSALPLLRRAAAEGRRGISLSVRSGMPADQLAALAARAEAGGFGAVLVTEQAADSIAHAAALVAATRHVAVGTALTIVASRNPATLAMAALTLDEWSGGRFVLGLGAGNAASNSALTGAPWDAPAARIEEFTAVVRAVLRDGAVPEHQGRYHTTRHTPLARPAPRDVPIMLGALQPRMLETAARIADVVLLNLADVAGARASAQVVRDAGRAAGRRTGEPLIACVVPCCVSDDAEAAWLAPRDLVLAYAGQPAVASRLARLPGGDALTEVRRLLAAGDAEAARRAVPDTVARAVLISGDASTCRAALAAFHDAVDLPVVFPVAGPAGWAASMEAALDAFAGATSG